MKTDRQEVERLCQFRSLAGAKDMLLSLLAEKEAADGVLEAVYVTAEKHAIALADARTKLAACEAASKPTAGKESESIPLHPKALAAVACLDKAGMDSDNSHDLADRFAATHSLETELNRLVYEALLQSHTYGSAKTMQTFIDFPGGKNVSVPLEPNEDIIDVIRSVELCDWEISPNDPGTVAHVGEVSAVYIYRAITKHFTTPPIATQDTKSHKGPG